MSESSVLGYWDIRGLAEPIRILLEHCNVKYEDKRYYTGEDWFSVKPTMGMDFPNLPYYIDGDFKLTESMAIMKYIARKHGMAPDTDEGWGKVEMVQGVIHDFWHLFAVMCYSDDHDNLKKEFIKNAPTTFAKFDSYLQNNTWLGGEKLTFIDFVLGELLDHLHLFYKDNSQPACYSQFANIMKFKDRFDNLDKVSSHRKAATHKPCMTPRSHWGG